MCNKATKTLVLFSCPSGLAELSNALTNSSVPQTQIWPEIPQFDSERNRLANPVQLFVKIHKIYSRISQAAMHLKTLQQGASYKLRVNNFLPWILSFKAKLPRFAEAQGVGACQLTLRYLGGLLGQMALKLRLLLAVHLKRVVELVVIVEHSANVVHVTQGDRAQKRGEVDERAVVVVSQPLFQLNSVARLPTDGIRVTVHHDHLGQVAVQVVEVLHVSAVLVVRRIAKQAVHNAAVLVQVVNERIGRHARFTREDDQLEQRRRHLLQEVVDSRTLLEAPTGVQRPVGVYQNT